MPDDNTDADIDDEILYEDDDDSGQAASTWRPPASQADLDRIIQDRLARATAKYADYDDVRSRAEQYDALARTTQTDTERAVEEARNDAWNAAMTSTVPLIVRGEFRTAAKGVLSPAQLDALLEDLDLIRYATDDGAADEEKIAKKIAAFAPSAKEKNRREFPDLGAGKRGGTAKTLNMNEYIRTQAGLSGD